MALRNTCIKLQKKILTNTKNTKKIIENIDIGGPAMVRSAAKNYKNVTIVTSREDYKNLIKGSFNEINKNSKGNYHLYRVGDAISSRNIHSAIFDSLRICKNI